MATVEFKLNPQDALSAFARVNSEGKLLTIWSLYDSLGRGVTQTVPAALFSQTVQALLRQLKQIGRQEQVEALRDMVNGAETRFAQEYAALNINMKLAFWYRITHLLPVSAIASDLSEASAADYGEREQIQALLRCVDRMDLNQQVHFLQNAVETA